MSRPLFVIALLLTALDAPVRAADDVKISREDGPPLVAAWTVALRKLDSGKDLAAYLAQHPTPVRVDERVSGQGVYQNGTIFIHQGMLELQLELVRKKGLREGAAVEALAWATLPVFAHEVQHAITHRRLAAETGAPYGRPDRDDELISMAREVRVLKEVARRFPGKRSEGYTIDDKELAAFMLGLGPSRFADLETLTAQNFRGVPCLRLDGKERLEARAKESAAYWTHEWREKSKSVAEAGSPLSAKSYQTAVDEAAEGIVRARSMLALTGDAARYEALRSFFARSRDDLAAQWAAAP